MRKEADYMERYQELGRTENPDTTLAMALLNAHTHTQIFENEVGNLEMQLKELTIRIRRIVQDALLSSGEGDSAVNVAQRIQHAVIWTLATLGLDNITGSAAETSQAQARVAELEDL